MFIIKVIFFDTETTGLDCFTCKIIELAMLTIEDGVVIDMYDEFINVSEPISPEIIRLTGITNDMLINDGLSEEIVAQDLKERLTADTLMIAHNCQFDLQFVYSLLKRHFPNEADDIVSSLDWLDTVSVLKDRKEFPHKLIDAVKYYNIPEVNFHRAIDDTKALYEVTMAMKSERDDLGEYINIFGFNPKYGVIGKRFEFIEYKSQSFHQRIVAPEFTLPNKR
ncbi:MAG: PolC-type DNA polymerase III [Methanobrevibacter sp.]|uniref:3'-5' exonuclease n=1 Tax=Methanobrevibacter sp. TaxID=66852 RepID=UPI003F046175